MSLRTISVVLLTLAAVCAGGAVCAAEKQPLNVLVIVSDDMTPRLGAMGYDQVRTPNLDRLARRGVLFDKAYCQYPLCGPSRASFMTGLRPDSTGVYDNATHIRAHQPDCVTMGQFFKQRGYQSLRIGKMFHYGVPYEIGTNGAGDDEATWTARFNPAGIDVEDEWSITNYMPRKGKHPDGRPSLGAALAWRADEGGDLVQTDGMIAAETIRLLREHQDKPFFIGCGFFRPHVPDVIPKEYLDLYPLDSIKLPTEPAEHLEHIPPIALWVKPANYGIAPDDLRKFLRAYYAAMSFVDAQVGKVIDAVDELGLADNTVIVFFSDHGWLLGEHGGQWQKMQLFELSAKVPLIISAPGGMSRGKTCDRPVELVDLYQTLAELAGLAAPANLEGHSLLPLLADPEAAWDHPAYTQVQRRVGKGKDRKMIMGRSVRTQRYRYTEWGDGGEFGIELYDYDKDPHEWHNRADHPSSKKLLAELKPLLAARP